MLTKFKRTQEQWGGSSKVIELWLDDRQRLIVSYCKLAVDQTNAKGTAPSLSELPSIEVIQVFCHTLVDYISTGHFKIYDMVKAKWEATGFKATPEINDTYFSIAKTTEPLLNFAEKYLDLHESDDLENFDLDLSRLGEILETRFAIEDHLIQLIADSLAYPPGA